MQYPLLCTLFICSLCFPVLAATDISPEMKAQIAAPMTMETGGKRKVIFNHNTHESVECSVCHHLPVNGNIYVSCASKGCHDIMGQKEKSVNGYFLALHKRDTDKSCVGCHQKLAKEKPELANTFKGCSPCHVQNNK